MKSCPNCNARIGDAARFCMKCGFNMEEYEEKQAAQEIFCPNCGTKFSGGFVCPECRCDVKAELEAMELEEERIAEEQRQAEEAVAARIAEEQRLAEEEEEERSRLSELKLRYFRNLYSDFKSNLHFSWTKTEYSRFGRARGTTCFGRDIPITWSLIDADEEKALLIADCWPILLSDSEGEAWCCFGEWSSEYEAVETETETNLDWHGQGHKGGFYTWESSNIRAWLNGIFYQKHLKNLCGDRMISTTLENGEDIQTEDKVFLLSKEEFRKYRGAISQVIKKTSSFKSVYVMLRSVTHDKTHDCIDYIYCESDGWLSKDDCIGGHSSEADYTSHVAVFPAFWVKHTDEMKEQIQEDKAKGRLFFLN